MIASENQISVRSLWAHPGLSLIPEQANTQQLFCTAWSSLQGISPEQRQAEALSPVSNLFLLLVLRALLHTHSYCTPCAIAHLSVSPPARTIAHPFVLLPPGAIAHPPMSPPPPCAITTMGCYRPAAKGSAGLCRWACCCSHSTDRVMVLLFIECLQ